MTIVDAAIIYLTLGSPIGMYRFFQLNRPSMAIRLAHGIFAALIWPFFVVISAIAISKPVIGDSVFDTRNELDFRIIGQIEDLKKTIAEKLFKLPGSSKQREIEALETYIELSIAKYSNSGVFETQREMLSVAGHPDAGLGAVCLVRRGNTLIERHQANSVLELIDAVFASERIEPIGIDADLTKLAELLHDQKTVALISKRMAEPKVVRSTPDFLRSNGNATEKAASIEIHTV